MRNLVLIVCAAWAAVAFAERQEFSRYQSIVDRQMFGPLPPGFDPTKSPSEVAKTKSKSEQELTKEQEQVKKSIRFSVMNVSAEGETYVGFTDSGDPKQPVHYYLRVGETQNGWTVKEADPESSSMTIANKEGIEVSLKLGGDSASNAGAVSRQGGVTSASAAGAARGASPLLGGLRSRRELRRQQEAQQAADAAKRAEEDKERAEREAVEKQQREAEREEQRKQLLQIQEELRKAREAREAESEADKKKSDEGES